MWKGLGLAALVVALLAAGPAWADRWGDHRGHDSRHYRSHHHYHPGYRPYRVVQPWGYYAPPRQRCWIEVQPGPFGYTEVQRCRPAAYPLRLGFFWDLD